MATVTQENIGLLHEKLNLTLQKEDYLPRFEKALKDYSRKANMPGFRKGQVPAGLIRKMYGSSLFTDEVLRTVDQELMRYLQESKVDIFAQPLPVDFNLTSLNVNAPTDYTFSFEIGRKPEFSLPELGKEKLTSFQVKVTDDMVEKEIDRLQNRYGNMKDLEKVESEDNVLNVVFTELNSDGTNKEGGVAKDNSLLVKYFAEAFRKDLIGKTTGDTLKLTLNEAFDEKEREWIIDDLGLKGREDEAGQKTFSLSITKIGLLEKRELNAEFFEQLYPGAGIDSADAFRNRIREEISGHWQSQSRNQLHDQIYHILLDHTQIDFPEAFLRRWMQNQGEKKKTDEELEAEFPQFLQQLKWTLISDKLTQEQNLEVSQDELRNFARQQLFGYMGMQNLDEEQEWVTDYINKMMKDERYLEDAYHRIRTQKIFEWAEQQVNPTEKEISAEEFAKMVEEHKH